MTTALLATTRPLDPPPGFTVERSVFSYFVADARHYMIGNPKHTRDAAIRSAIADLIKYEDAVLRRLIAPLMPANVLGWDFIEDDVAGEFYFTHAERLFSLHITPWFQSTPGVTVGMRWHPALAVAHAEAIGAFVGQKPLEWSTLETTAADMRGIIERLLSDVEQLVNTLEPVTT